MPNDVTHSRVGIAVSKKVSKLAVERNRIKRQIRDSFRHYLLTEQMNAGGTDFVLVAKTSAKGVENSEIRMDLDASWEKALKYAKPAAARGPRRGKKPDQNVRV